jgi:arylsulfatase A-like enzyme
LRAGKGYLYEGGVRVPWIVKWPGVTPAESECSVPVVSNDFFPTLAEIAKARIASANDGVSLVPLLKNPAAPLDRRAIYWHYPHFSNQGGQPGGAVRMGRFKLIERYERGELELYDLEQDLSEQHNLAEKLPKQAAELKRMLGDWRQATGAQMPEPNPNYRP